MEDTQYKELVDLLHKLDIRLKGIEVRIEHGDGRFDRICEKLELQATLVAAHDKELAEMKASHQAAVRTAKLFGWAFGGVFAVAESATIIWALVLK